MGCFLSQFSQYGVSFMRLFALFIGLIGISAASAEDWPQWLGPKRDGVWRETGLIETFPKEGLKPTWEIPVGQGYAGPAVAKGKVFLMDRKVEVGAAEPKSAFDKSTVVRGNERVFCVDSKTGKQLWEKVYPCNYRISYSAGPRCTPTVDDDRVYTLGAMGDLHCLNVNDGEILWKKNFMTDFGANVPVWGFSSHPLVDGDLLICLVGGTEGRLVMAFDKKTGAEKWRSLSFESGDFGYAPPVIFEIAGKRQLVIWHPKALVSLDPATGKKFWEVATDSRAALTVPQVRQQGNKLFISAFYHGSTLVEAGADSAKILWKSKAKGERPDQTTDLSSIMATPVWKGENIYGVCSYGELRCIEAETGKRVWASMKAIRGPLTPATIQEREAPSVNQPWAERWGLAFIIENGDRYVLFNEQGVLIFATMTPKGYEEISRTQILQPTNKLAGRPVVWMHPAFAEKSIFARNDEKLIRIDLAK
jgi:outer membrane protein assembly factor BamB